MKEFVKKIIPPFLLSWYHFLLAFLGALVFGFPSRKIKVIGITGTNGKSTTVEMVSKILEEADFKIAALSSIKFKIGEKEWPNKLRMTMPGRFILQGFLRQAVNAGCDYVVLEVTSEGIKQHRHRFIDFEIAVFTNLSPEHIEAHGSFEKYKEAKGKLFQVTKKIHILNLDDENGEYFLHFPAKNKYGYGLTTQENNNTKYKTIATNYRTDTRGISFQVNKAAFKLNLLGAFNIYNALAAISLAQSQNISLEICQKALGKVKEMPGRMELVIGEPFWVFVDYAFTPNALEKVYQTIKNHFKPGKIICVLGSCGGGRDKWKRPILGGLAAKYCQEIIVTNEDPYDEDPMEIINQVASGTNNKAKKILNRREAIGEALRLARPKDVVIITGKGCEPSICLAGGKRIPWDDRQVVREEFQKLENK